MKEGREGGGRGEWERGERRVGEGGEESGRGGRGEQERGEKRVGEESGRGEWERRVGEGGEESRRGGRGARGEHTYQAKNLRT